MNPLLTIDLAAIHRNELLEDAARSRRAPVTEPTLARVVAAFRRTRAVHFVHVPRARRVQG
jgi:hypothetical protein